MLDARSKGVTEVDSFAVLHLYYKLTYIKLSWGGPTEKAAEIARGNLAAKDWHDKARKVVEDTVHLFFLTQNYSANYELTRCFTITKLAHPLLPLSIGLPRLKLPHPAKLPPCLNSTNIVKPCFPMIWRKDGPLN